jgi:hypothetical protein
LPCQLRHGSFGVRLCDKYGIEATKEQHCHFKRTG